MNSCTSIGVPRIKETNTAESCDKTGTFSIRIIAIKAPSTKPIIVATNTIIRVVGKADKIFGKYFSANSMLNSWFMQSPFQKNKFS